MSLSETQITFQRHIRQLVERYLAPHAEEIETASRFPEAAHLVFAREKLYCLALPASYGGPAADAATLALMVENVARHSPSGALLLFPTNAVVRVIAQTGTDEQKTRFFHELKNGDKPLAFCLTEPDHGSDAFNLTTTAVSDGDHYLVNGTKSFVTLGPHARYYLTFVRTGPAPKAGGISVLLIPHDAPGLEFGPAEKKMGLHGSITSQLYLNKVRVPKANRLWQEGEGWRVLTEVANPMRVWGAAAMALGTAEGLFKAAWEHAQMAQEGGHRLLEQQACAFALAEMRMKIEADRSLIYRVCAMLDSGTHSHKELEAFTSMAKCFSSDTALEVANLAGEVLGLAMARDHSLAARLFCVAKGIQIFDGSNQIQRMIISRNLAVF